MKLVILPGFDGTDIFLRTFKDHLPQSYAPQIITFPDDIALDYQGLCAHITAQLPQENFVLLGQSFSGSLCIQIAEQNPPYLKGVILAASFSRKPLPLALNILAKSILRIFRKIVPPKMLINYALLNNADSKIAADISKQVKTMKPDVFMARAYASLTSNTYKHLSDITIPVLILSARNDRLMRANASKEMAAACQYAHYQEINGAHFLLQTAPKQIIAAIEIFIKSL